MNLIDLVKLKISIENFLQDKISTDDFIILKQHGYIQAISNGHELQIIYPDKKDMQNVLKAIKIKLGE